MRLHKAATALLILSALSACMNVPVKKENRDVTGKYDGHWTIHYVMAKTVQRIGQVRYSCTQDEGTLSLQIKNAEITGDLQAAEPIYVDNQGHINFVSAHSEGGFSSDKPGNEDPGSRILMSIDLKESSGTGKMIFAMGTGNSGCPGTLTLTKHGN